MLCNRKRVKYMVDIYLPIYLSWWPDFKINKKLIKLKTSICCLSWHEAMMCFLLLCNSSIAWALSLGIVQVLLQPLLSLTALHCRQYYLPISQTRKLRLQVLVFSCRPTDNKWYTRSTLPLCARTVLLDGVEVQSPHHIPSELCLDRKLKGWRRRDTSLKSEYL